MFAGDSIISHSCGINKRGCANGANDVTAYAANDVMLRIIGVALCSNRLKHRAFCAILSLRKCGGHMKKFFSLVLFVLVIALFIFELCFAVAGAVDTNNQLDELAARGAGGHELLGVGLDIIVLCVVFFSIIGGVISLVSWKVAQYQVIRIASAVMCPLFLVPIFTAALILTL